MSDDSGLQKQCHKCGEMRSLEAFARNKRSPDGLDHRCKTCERARYEANMDVVKARAKVYREDNAEHVRQVKKKYCDAHRQEKSAYDRARYEEKGDEIRAQKKAYREANREIIRARKKKYYAANRERILEYLRAWHAANTEYVRKKYRDYYSTNSEKIKASVKKWAASNLHKTSLYRYRRRAYILGNGGHFTLKEYNALIEAQAGFCAYCGNAADKLTIEHILPVSRGGRHDISNICLACPRCNFTKQAKTLEEWVDRWYLR